jgi:hypothetical protein
MNDSDEGHSCQNKIQELTQIDADDPEPERLLPAACDVNAIFSI